MQLQDKVIVITGASDGIGKEIALRVSREGGAVALIGRDLKRLESVQKESIAAGASDARMYQCDISQLDQIKSTVTEIAADFGKVDILINNAGIWQKLTQLDEMEDDVIGAVLDINLKGLVYMTKYVLPILRKQPEAIIMNVSSKSGVTAQAGQTAYTASKYGVRGFTEVLKADLKETNIKIAGIYQSGTNTKMFSKVGEDFPVENFMDPADFADTITTILLSSHKVWLHEVRIGK